MASAPPTLGSLQPARQSHPGTAEDLIVRPIPLATALSGAVLQMINHGLSTGALFLLVGVLYERRHSREITAYGGIAGVVPITTALFLVATLSSIGLPGLNGFVGEFLILLGTWTSPHRAWAVLAATGVILSAIYMLTLVQRVFWNPITHDENRSLPDIRPTELVAAGVLVLLMIWIGVRPNDVLSRINPSVEALREQVSAKVAGRDGRGDGVTGRRGVGTLRLLPVPQSPRPPVAISSRASK